MKLAPADGTTADVDGWITQRVEFDCLNEARFVVLGLGPSVEVLEPEPLRARVLADASAIVARAASPARQLA